MAAAFWVVMGSLLLAGARRADFLNLYTGASLAHSGQYSRLYDYSAQSAVSRRLEPDVTLVFPFVRPPFYALALSPLALLPYDHAFRIWIGIQTTLLLACWGWAWKVFGPDALVWTSLFLPTALGIASGQDCVVTFAIGCAVWEAYRRRLDTLTGLLLALTLIKFHLFLLIPLALIAGRRWRMLGGYISGTLALLAVSLGLSGWSGLQSYAALLTRQDLATLSPSPERMMGINAVLANFGIHWLPLTLALSCVVATLVMRSAATDATGWHWLWAAVAGSLLISPHTYQYDAAALLVPGLLAVFQGETRTLRVLGAILLTPLLYGLNLAGPPYSAVAGIVLMLFLLALAGVLPVHLRTRAATTHPDPQLSC